MHVTVFKTDRYSRAKVIIEVKAEQFQFMFKSIFNTRPEMLKEGRTKKRSENRSEASRRAREGHPRKTPEEHRRNKSKGAEKMSLHSPR